jgi:hypothetical protein
VKPEADVDFFIVHLEGPIERMIYDDNVRLSYTYLGGTVANREAQL